jgi:hypothetical protein
MHHRSSMVSSVDLVKKKSKKHRRFAFFGPKKKLFFRIEPHQNFEVEVTLRLCTDTISRYRRSS